jgi:hypothetical protein
MNRLDPTIAGVSRQSHSHGWDSARCHARGVVRPLNAFEKMAFGDRSNMGSDAERMDRQKKITTLASAIQRENAQI